MDKCQVQRLLFVIIFAATSLLGYSVLRVDAMTVTSLSDDYSKDIKQLTTRVADLEKRLIKIDSVLMKLQSPPERPVPDKDATNDPQNDDESTPPASAEGDIVIIIDSFSKIPDDLKLIAEADELKSQDSVDQKEIKRLEEQFRKLLDAFKELEKRDEGRSMSEVEYRRLCQENTNQRGDISKVMSKIKEEMNKRKNLEKFKRREAIGKGQKIAGHIGAKNYIVFTKTDCSKIVAQGVKIRLVNPKSIQSSNGVEEYEVSRVELASKQK